MLVSVCSTGQVYEPKHLGEVVNIQQTANTVKALQYEINFHQFQMILKDIKGFNKIIVSQYKIREVNYTTTCANTIKGSYCQDYNLLMLPFQQLNLTIKNCMEDVYIYLVPPDEIDSTNPPTLSVFLSLLHEDKVCNGFFTSDQLMFCAKYKVEPCLMMPECYTICGELDCWRGEEKSPFFNLVVPKNISTDNAKNLCIFYNSVDTNRCHGCQIYVDIFKFESSSPTLEPFEEFLFSIILVFIVLVVIIIAYYNLALAIRGHPPFKVCEWLPQILFPRGARGLGKHNVEEEMESSGVGQRDDFKQISQRNYRQLAGGQRINNRL